MNLSMPKLFRGVALTSLVGLAANFLSAADVRVDVSRIITRADAESILGESVKEAHPRNIDGQDGYYSKCNYYSAKPGKSLVIRVYEPAPNAIDPQKQLELIAASSGPMKPVSGVGDKAQMFSGGDIAVAPRVLMLYVAKGNAFITVGLSGTDDENAGLEKAKGIAQKLLEHL
jgi:hypothetical protein